MMQIVRGVIILVLAVIGIAFSHEYISKRNLVEVEDESEAARRVIKRKPASRHSFEEHHEYEPQHIEVTASPASDLNLNQSFYSSNDENTDNSDSKTQESSQQVMANESNLDPADTSSQTKKDIPSKSVPEKSHSPSIMDAIRSSEALAITAIPQNGIGKPTDRSQIVKPEPYKRPLDKLGCSTSVGGGAFGNPLKVEISCTAAADIKYCLQENFCCDPEVNGTTYTSPLIIGAESGNYCLSFYGEAQSMKVSKITQESYTVNNTYPDLRVSFPKIYYQTTQLAGYNYLASDDFSKSNFWIGQINIKTHDPGPAALNLDCQDIIEGYYSLPAPVAKVVFNPINMAGINSGNQLNVPLMLDKLAYGINFITSYVVNNNFASPLYSCSTNKVTLNDFDLFVPEASHGEQGTNEVREFSGSFVAYSFFEDDTDLHRTPAGVASIQDTDQELRTGSFGIFY
jgi:hypothetical protein